MNEHQFLALLAAIIREAGGGKDWDEAIKEAQLYLDAAARYISKRSESAREAPHAD